MLAWIESLLYRHNRRIAKEKEEYLKRYPYMDEYMYQLQGPTSPLPTISFFIIAQLVFVDLKLWVFTNWYWELVLSPISMLCYGLVISYFFTVIILLILRVGMFCGLIYIKLKNLYPRLFKTGLEMDDTLTKKLI